VSQQNQEPGSEIILYQTEGGNTRLEVKLENNTVWLTQKQMAELFQTTIPNVNMHLRNVYAEGELQAEATLKEFLIVRPEGNRQVSRAVEHYNLDAIIAVGYRVKSQRGRGGAFGLSVACWPAFPPCAHSCPNPGRRAAGAAIMPGGREWEKT
jgi:hypothetical protein